jgi:hypothetical protein
MFLITYFEARHMFTDQPVLMKSPYFMSLNKRLMQTDENSLKKNLTLAFIKWKGR